MAVVEMQKFNLVAMSYERDRLLNALQKTGAVEVKLHTETAETEALAAGGEELRVYLSSAEAALSLLVSAVAEYDRESKKKSDLPKDGFEVSYSEFMSAGGKKEEADGVVARVNALWDERKELTAELSKTVRAVQSAAIYAAIDTPLGAFKDTAHVKIKLGAIPAAAKEELCSKLNATPLAAVTELAADGDRVLVCAAVHKSAAEEAEAALQEAGFAASPYGGESTGEQVYASLLEKERELNARLAENKEALYALKDEVRMLKIYCDYVGYELEKAELAENLRATRRTFLLEGYVPAGAEQAVEEAVASVTDAAYCEFSKPAEEEMPPTLLNNNEVVKNFEAITNMYSVPCARELDPNAVMAFFYSLFLGFIMGDIGYGLVMLVGGGVLYAKTRAADNGLNRLSGVFAIGGIFAIVWGILFNSLFGISLPFLPTVMPDAQNDMWSFVGISVPAVLVISLIIGTVQLLAGYVCRAWQCWRRGQFWDGVWDGVVWSVFSAGVVLAVVGLIDDFGLTELAYIGGILAGVSLVVAMLTAGRKEKLLGKFTKGFGAAYGVINYASDVLSYARLYGLMLSGAVIAQIVSEYSIAFITGGNFGLAIVGVVLMAVGHAFNLAIGLLGAYIHDARLQYVEFYGRFYEGEGRLFAPIGSQHKYVKLAN